ncbi:MAG: M6 family metalloprotease domain-containing protein [Bacteroidales bacterium]|nr:M6 family metalloprotease domain-containing protein [Bacteroidales bacterium]
MKKHILISAIALLVSFVASYAIPAYPGIMNFKQPDGTTIQVRLHGDEFSSWYTTPSGTVLEFDSNGFLKPAVNGQAVVNRARQQSINSPKRMTVAPPSNTITTGTVHIPVIIVQFSDVAFTVTGGDPGTAFSNMLNQAGYSVNGATGSVADFYHDNSNDAYQPIFDVFGPVTLTETQAFYGGTNPSSGSDDKAAEALFQAAVQLDTTTTIDFSQYDADGDGLIDMVLMYYAGENQAEGGGAYTIWPHQWDMYSAWYYGHDVDPNYNFDGKKLRKYFCTSEINYAGTMAGIGTTCHEFAHSLGLPDVYDINYESNGYSGGTYDYDTMCSGSYNNEGMTPPFFNAFELELLGWDVTLEALPASGDASLPAFSKGLKKAYRSESSTADEYFLYECRASSWDTYVDEAGLVVYHIDKSTRDVHGKTAAYWWSDWTLNVFGDHPCGYIIPAGAQNYTTGPGVSSGLYYTGYDFAFGVGGYTSYTPVDWAGETMAYTLGSIAFDGSTATFNMGSGFPGTRRMSYIYDPNAGVYSAGDPFELTLVPSTVDVPTSTAWYYDGVLVDTPTVTLTAGEHVIEARLTLTSGATQTVELELDVN